MTPNIILLNRKLLGIYEEQYDRFYELYEQKHYIFFDYLEVSCEQIVFTIEKYIEPTEESGILQIKFESLLALIKAEMEKVTWQNVECTLKSKRFSKTSFQNKNKKHIS